MSDTKVLALVLLTVFSAFIFQWAYYSSVDSDTGGLIWVDDIDEELSNIKLEEPKEPKIEPWSEDPRAITAIIPVEEEEEPGWWARHFPGITGVWNWGKRSHIFDIFTFNIWKNIKTPVPRGIQYTFSLIMGIIIYAIPAYIVVKLIRGGG